MFNSITFSDGLIILLALLFGLFVIGLFIFKPFATPTSIDENLNYQIADFLYNYYIKYKGFSKNEAKTKAKQTIDARRNLAKNIVKAGDNFGWRYKMKAEIFIRKLNSFPTKYLGENEHEYFQRILTFHYNLTKNFNSGPIIKSLIKKKRTNLNDQGNEN